MLIVQCSMLIHSANSTVLITQCCLLSTVLIAQCQYQSANCTVLIAPCQQHSAHSPVLIAYVQQCPYSTCLQHNPYRTGHTARFVWRNAFSCSFKDILRRFGVNSDMSRITRFLCYFLSLKLTSVLSYYAFPSLWLVSFKQRVTDCQRWRSLKKKFYKYFPYFLAEMEKRNKIAQTQVLNLRNSTKNA